MRRRLLLLGLPLAGVGVPAVAATALAARLGDGRHVLLMRHADAPGYDDPPGMRLDDCRTQRNLGERGRQQAHAMGQWLRAQGVAQAWVGSSPWCRCVETARLLALGPVQVEPALGSFFAQPQLAAARTAELRALLQRLRAAQPPAPAHILVTHQVNIRAYVGAAVSSAESVLVRVGPQGEPLDYEFVAAPLPR